MSPRELLEALVRLGSTDDLRRMYAGVSPLEVVQVPAFLCGRSPLLGSTVSRLGHEWSTHETAEERRGNTAAALSANDAASAVEEFGWGLITDAQWEYAARCGGVDSWAGGKSFARAVDALVFEPHFDASTHQNDWGLWGLSLGEWVADAGTPHEYRGGGVLHAPWQDSVETLSCHAAARPRSGKWRGVFCARPTIDLPSSWEPTTMELPRHLSYGEVHALFLRFQKEAKERGKEPK